MYKVFLASTLFLITMQVPALNQNDAPHAYYVIVGGFSVQENAARFTSRMHEKNYPAQYAYNTERNLYYVYVYNSFDKRRAQEVITKIKSNQEFKDAWIYDGKLGTQAFTEVTGTQTAAAMMGAVSAGTNDFTREQPLAGNSTSEEKRQTLTSAAPQNAPTMPAGKPFVFRVVNSATNTLVSGNIKVVESERDKGYQNYQTNAMVYVPSPKTGKIVITCDLVGYKPFKKAIKYENLLKGMEGASRGANDEIIVPITLKRLKKGSYIDFDGVRFHKHSAILTPESESELMELALLMKDNKYKVRLHGHVGSKESQQITILGTSPDFFALNEGNKRIMSSARELSRYRAETIKKYLVSKGIDPRRIATKGMGAMLSIYQQAAANERIEIEIIKY